MKFALIFMIHAFLLFSIYATSLAFWTRGKHAFKTHLYGAVANKKNMQGEKATNIISASINMVSFHNLCLILPEFFGFFF